MPNFSSVATMRVNLKGMYGIQTCVVKQGSIKERFGTEIQFKTDDPDGVALGAY